MFFEVFFEKFSFPFLLFIYQSFNELFRVLRGANVTSVFKSHKLFWIFFWKNFSVSIRVLVSISRNACRCCGCKSTTFIYIYKTFFYKISTFCQTFS